MSFNKVVSRLLGRRKHVKHWWTPVPDTAHCYYMMVNVGHPEGDYQTKNVSIIRLNEVLSLNAQKEVMDRLCWVMDLEN